MALLSPGRKTCLHRHYWVHTGDFLQVFLWGAAKVREGCQEKGCKVLSEVVSEVRQVER